MSGNVFAIKCLRDSLLAMPETSCILYRYSGNMRILSGSSAIGRSPFPNLRRHLPRCCRDWSWPILMSSLSSKTVKNIQRGIFFADAAVMWALELIGMTIYICLQIDIPLWHFNLTSYRCKFITYCWSKWLLLWRLREHIVIIWPIRISSHPSLGIELSFGSSLSRVGRLRADYNCYLLHYHILSYYHHYVFTSYHIIISWYSCYKVEQWLRRCNILII